jgi:hypothetical protein
VDGSVVRRDTDHGALLVEATSTTLRTRFYNVDGLLLDEVTLE